MMIVFLKEESVYYSGLRNPGLNQMKIKQWAIWLDYMKFFYGGMRVKEHQKEESFVLPGTTPRTYKICWKLGLKEWI